MKHAPLLPRRALATAYGVVGCLSGLLLQSASAQTWTPTASGSTYNWNTDTNWSSSPFPNGEGAIANINNNITGGQTIRLQQDITLGILNFGDENGSHAFVINAGSPSTNTLFFDGVGTANAQLNIRNAGTITNRIEAPVTLLSDLDLTLEPNLNAASNANSARLIISGIVNIGSYTLAAYGGYEGPSDQTQLTFDNAVVGSGTIINNSVSPMSFRGNTSAFTGTIVASGRGLGGTNVNTITIGMSASFANAAEMVINGALTHTNGLGQLGGAIRQGSGESVGFNHSQRFTSNLMTFNGGTLEASAYAIEAVAPDDVGTGTGTDTAWRRGEEWLEDTIATINFNSGGSKIQIGTSSNIGTRLTGTQVLRSQGSTLSLARGGGNPLGSGTGTSRAEFYIGNWEDYMVGAGGAAGTQNMSIIPWIAVADSSGSTAATNHPQQLATYDAAGVRALRSTEYANSINSGTGTANVSVSSVSGGTNAVVNALRYTGSGISNIGAGNSLTVSSGAVLFTSSTGGIGAGEEAGTLNFGSAEGIIWVNGSNTGAPHENSIGASIAGSGGLTKTGAGNLTLTGANTYTGLTYVATGTLSVGDGVTVSNLGDGDVTVAQGATLTLRNTVSVQNPDIISDNAVVRLQNFGGLLHGVIRIDAGIVDTVAGLWFGDVQQAFGTWGSSTSGAQYTNDDYFSGDGMLYVVPEPSSAALLLLGISGLAARRRRKA